MEECNSSTNRKNMKYLREELGKRKFEEVNGGNIKLRFLRGIVRCASATRSAPPSPPWKLRLGDVTVGDGDLGRRRSRLKWESCGKFEPEGLSLKVCMRRTQELAKYWQT